MCFDLNIDGAGRRLDRLALFLRDCLIEHFEVHFVADLLHLTVLLSAENAACTADLKVAHRNPEAAAELREFTHCIETLLRDLGQRAVLLIGEICIGTAV